MRLRRTRWMRISMTSKRLGKTEREAKGLGWEIIIRVFFLLMTCKYGLRLGLQVPEVMGGLSHGV